VDQRLALATLIHDAFSTDDMVRTLSKLKKNGNVKCVAVAESSNHGPVNSKRQGDFVLGCITVSALACDHMTSSSKTASVAWAAKRSWHNSHRA
jgi:hypothetical protein